MTPVLLIGVIALASLSLGCASSEPSRVPQQAEQAAKQDADAELQQNLEASIANAEEISAEFETLRNLRFVGMDDGPVPEFSLKAVDGVTFDAETLVGRVPFVVAFFATWCDSCERKLASMAQKLRQLPPMPLIPVSVDGPETFDRVAEYLESVGIGESAVRASEYPMFSFSYNPFNAVPLLVIVGRNGGLVDYQIGYDEEQDQRLLASLRLAQTIGPLATPDARESGLN